MTAVAVPDVPVNQGPGKALIFAMAAAAGIAAANMYYNQPMLGVIEQEFPHTGATRLIPPATQVGFAVGMFLLVPLGDLMDRRRLIVTQFIVLGLALAAAAVAPSAVVLVAASLMIGVCSSAAQQIVPFAASMATEKSRGKTLGTVMGGLLSGILLSRTLAGFVADHQGWRAMFWLGVPLVVVAAVLMRAMLPPDARGGPQRSELSYPMALRSLAHLWRSEPLLRSAAMVQAGIFASFSAFWSVLALHLQDFGYGPDAAGLFGIVGMVGVLAAPIAGRLADKRGPRLVIVLGAGLVLFAWVLFALWTHVVGLIVGVILLDFGVQSAMVSNQHVIYALRPDARNRLNTLFMTCIFLGGAAGSAGAVAAWSFAGWNGVSIFAALTSLLALVAITLTRRASDGGKAA